MQGSKVLVLCGPSGSGKSSLLRLLFEEFPDKFGFCVSHTTRSPRPGEENGKHYHFTTKEEMEQAVTRGEFLETAVFSNNMYGTNKAAVNTVTDSGKICVLDIDVEQVKKTDLKPLLVLIKPPSLAELEKRLRGRNTETEDSLQRRLDAARKEMVHGETPGNFHLILVNDNLDKMYKKLKEFVLREFEQSGDMNGMEEQTLPEWMTNDFFNKSLQKKKGREDITVTNFTTSTVVPPGNNYGSFILRVNLEYKQGDDQELHSLSLIVKSEHCQGPMKDLAEKFQPENMKLNEPAFYYKFIPKVKKFTDAPFVPDTFFSSRPNVTVLEDLKGQGFVMADRFKQLDFDHCKLYMKAAAVFHSVSVAVYKEHPDLLESVRNTDFFSNDSKMRGVFEVMLVGGLHCFVDAIKKIDRFNKYSETITNAIPNMWDMFADSNKPNESVNTIRQGDPWTTNMMFKYDEEGKVCEVKIIDFQGTSYGSPVNDLMFFIWTSATNEVKRSNLRELYKIYIDNFNKNLEQFNCTERLTQEQFEKEVRRLSPYVLFVAGCFLPSLRDPEPMDMAALFSQQNDVSYLKKFYQKYYHEEYCNQYLPQLLECLEATGVFDYFESQNKSDN